MLNTGTYNKREGATSLGIAMANWEDLKWENVEDATGNVIKINAKQEHPLYVRNFSSECDPSIKVRNGCCWFVVF